jgi:hypothetical protein
MGSDRSQPSKNKHIRLQSQRSYLLGCWCHCGRLGGVRHLYFRFAGHSETHAVCLICTNKIGLISGIPSLEFRDTEALCFMKLSKPRGTKYIQLLSAPAHLYFLLESF